MCKNSTERGFTLPELIAVILLISILSAVALPRLQGALSFRDDGWHDQVMGALRLAQKTAVSHRRLVCVDIGAGTVTLSIAAANPAASCGTALQGVDGSPTTARSSGSTASLSPVGTIYFQPSGRVTSDGAGNTAQSRTVSIVGQSDIVLIGETGHVH